MARCRVVDYIEIAKKATERIKMLEQQQTELLGACERITNLFACQRMPGFAKCRENNRCCICNARVIIAKIKERS